MHVVPLPRDLSPTGPGALRLGGSPRVAVPSDHLLGLGQVVAGLLEGTAQVGGAAELVLALDETASEGEEYTLVVTEAGATVSAGSAAGLFRGATTVAQLVTPERTVPCVRVSDGPALAWRGLSLDVARHFFPVEQVKRVVDLLALYKFNVLHLHLSDSQAWRLEIGAWPRLTGPERYTHDDYREIVAYAAERFVTVVPELDMPGHVLAAVRAYPELGGLDEPAHPLVPFLDPRAEVVWRFVADVLGEVAALTPGPYLHLGGDEAFGMPEELYTAFVSRALGLARATGKRVVGWQEVSRSGALTPADLVQCWVGDGDAFDAEAARKTAPPRYHPLIDLAARAFEQAPHDVPGAVAAGAAVLASPSRVLYLDRRYAEPSVLPEQNERRERVGFASYRPMTSRQYFAWQPGELVEIPRGARLAGVEAAVWCETVGSFDDLAFLLLPRLAGIAEKAWTERATTWEDYRERVAAHTSWWERLGWGGYYRSAELFPART
ncbi:beta-N-acetylhexosaminidase [Nonomuraea gerenzanensis]|uniref:beta-N-acetylhexosaminidase n=1 Tax=Nonomuraea gerenzanensis TaxID=93944 RepID=A0A1M4EQS1_9ACTN|nr:family 20 glycosylhydrolase [Nonomuraea gerenzanensis]UBU12631.1 beta-N-acetylhexosaminidase [Nonomuraea gerenzanensis]SBP01186.1 Beta-hexosaminidase [Nonomuraea gerenzanensis]